jgi:hypothetical protein
LTLNHLRVCLLLVASTACASKDPTPVFTPEGTPAPSRAIRRDPNLITRDELADAKLQSQSVLEVVRQLRPKFLNVRGTKASTVHAAIDSGPVVPLDALQSLHVAGVVEIRYLNPAQAMQRYGGASREGPVIVVKTL